MLSIPSPNALDATRLVVERTSSPKPVPDSSTLVFGQTFTDHMLTVRWNISTGWDAPVIKPYAPLQLDPASTVLHYAPTLFEGLKAYKGKDGVPRLFRPDKVRFLRLFRSESRFAPNTVPVSQNMERMNRSAARLAFPV